MENTQIREHIEGTIFDLLNMENGQTGVIIGNTLIAKYDDKNTALNEIADITENKIILATMFEIARTVHEKHDEIYAAREQQLTSQN